MCSFFFFLLVIVLNFLAFIKSCHLFFFQAEEVNFNSFKAATSCPNLKRLCWGILTDDDTVPNNTLELRDSDQNESVVKKMSFQELFQALVKHNPGVKVELKCLPRSIWSEFCSSRNFM